MCHNWDALGSSLQRLILHAVCVQHVENSSNTKADYNVNSGNVCKYMTYLFLIGQYSGSLFFIGWYLDLDLKMQINKPG